ncbi:hypothetical protein BDV19DRAFT_362424 [Aspergillus venezuelensis]
MAPTISTRKPISKASQRARRAPKFRKQHKKKNPGRIQKQTARSSPRSKLAQGRGSLLAKQAAKPRHKQALAVNNTNNKPTSTRKVHDKDIEIIEVIPKPSPRAVKYQLATQWPSPEPYEVNCLQRDPLPAGYVFVPRGDVYITRNCRSKTKESQKLVYKVFDDTGKKALGIRVPHNILHKVQTTAKATASTRAAAVALRDEKDLASSRALLQRQFPLLPDDQLEHILHHAYLKGSGRVGRTSTTSDKHKAVLAVEAHIRHMHTPYEALLKEGKDREAARKAVWPTVQAVRAAWMGEGQKGEKGRPKRLSLRSSSG